MDNSTLELFDIHFLHSPHVVGVVDLHVMQDEIERLHDSGDLFLTSYVDLKVNLLPSVRNLTRAILTDENHN